MTKMISKRLFANVRKLVKFGTVTEQLPIPPHIVVPKMPSAADELKYIYVKPYILNNNEIQQLKDSAKITKEMLDYATELVQPGVTTDEIDKKIHNKIISYDAYPSCYNYKGYPKSIATSVNEVVCHGIPDTRPLEDGDMVNVDLSVFYKGFHSDSSRMYLVGNVDKTGKALVETTYNIMMGAINLCKPGLLLNEIGDYIYESASANGYSVPEDYCSHGVGRFFHMYPYILHIPNRLEVPIVENMAFTIEPMINEGKKEVSTESDKWTVVTKDKKRSAQFEHTILITSNGFEILT